MSVSTVAVTVPASGDGPLADVSSLVGPKTVQMNGRYQGPVVLLGSHDDSTFVPLLQFDAGGEAQIEQTVSGSFKSFKVRVLGTLVGTVTCTVTAETGIGENAFAAVASLAAGSSGSSPSIDTYALFPATGLEEEICFACAGNFRGSVVVEGSPDNSQWNPIGSFRLDRPTPSTPTVVELPLLSTADKVRYLRVTVDGSVTTTTTVTVGGRKTGSSGGSLMPVYVYAGAVGTAYQALSEVVPLDIGSSSVVIGYGCSAPAPASSATVVGVGCTSTAANGVAVGVGNSVPGANSVAIGVGNSASGSGAFVASGGGASVAANTSNGIAIGGGCRLGDSASATNSLAVGSGSTVNSIECVAVGRQCVIGQTSDNTVAVGSVITINSGASQRSVAVGFSITLNNSTLETVAIGNLLTVDANTGSSVLIGTNLTSSCGSGVIIGHSCSASGVNAIAIGNSAVATTQTCVLGGPGAGTCLHAFTVQGFNGVAMPTLKAVDNPGAGETGITLVADIGAGAVSKLVKAAVTPPVGSVLLYVDP